MTDSAVRRLDLAVEGCAAAHQQLLSALDAIDDDACRAPSRLPGWTRGHLLAHLARNAESHVRLFEAAARGEVAEQYPGGGAAREAAIESGASRDARSLVADVRSSVYALESAWAGATPSAWDGHGLRASGARVAVRDLVLLRWREVEVHHVDLDIGLSFADWSPAYVRLDLEALEMTWRARQPMGLGDLPEGVRTRPPHERLAWLLGRLPIPGVPAPDPY
jgi:maleylpyruvate isomerase